MGPHHAIVADLDQIVELDSGFDERITQRSTVNTGIGANLYRIANDDTSNLRNLALCTIWQGIKAKTIRPNDGAAVDDHPASKMDPRIETDMRIQDAAGADLARCTDIGPGIYRDVIPQAYAALNHDIRPNINTCTEFHVRSNDRTGINAPGGMLRREKVFQQMNESQIGLCDTNSRAINAYLGSDQHSRST